MQYFWAALFILASTHVAVFGEDGDAPHTERIERPENNKFGPTLIAKGDGYLIHGFFGSITPPREHLESLITPGVVLIRTDTETGEAGVVMATGTYAIPTRRASFNHRRLVGMLVTDLKVYTASYHQRTWDAPPGDPGANERVPGEYQMNVYDLETGRFLTRHIPVQHATRLPDDVPPETLGEGAILPNEEGFSIFGAQFIIQEDGRLQPVEPDAEDKQQEKSRPALPF